MNEYQMAVYLLRTAFRLDGHADAIESHVRGMESRLMEAGNRDRVARAALRALLDRYVSLVESGDAGHWDQETEDCVVSARAALAGPP